MAVTTKFTGTAIKDWTESGSNTASRSYASSVSDSGTKVSGSFITLPDGSKFRRATTISRRRYGLTPEGPQIFRGKSFANRRDYDISNGGWWPDELMSANCPLINGGNGNPGKLNLGATIPTPMRNEAVTKALLEIADQKANLGESLATFRQTQALISGPASALYGSLKSAWNNRSLRPHLSKRPRDVPRDIASLYLQYVYGWLPLMSDIHGIMELMKERGLKRPLLVHGKGSSNQQSQAPSGSYADVSHKTVNVLGPLDVEGKVTCNIWARIDPESAGLRSLNQLGLLNPLALAYELTPWSFVVDWFIPIGSVLNALTAPAGLIFVDGSVSGKWKMSGPYTTRYNHFTVTSTTVDREATGKVFHESWTRQPLGTWPLPNFWVDSNPLRGDRPFKALALAILNLRSLKE